jgi:transcriptional regulator with XRE-family HTH domain
MQNIRDEAILKSFGDKLRKARVVKGKTQEQLAEDAGISQVQVARIENGKINTSLCTIQRLLDALGVKANVLFD